METGKIHRGKKETEISKTNTYSLHNILLSSNLIREVSIKIKLADGSYQTIAGPFDIPTTTQLADDKFYFSVVHNLYQGSFTFKGIL